MPQRRIYLRDDTRELSFTADQETLLAILASARKDEDNLYQLLEEARRAYGATDALEKAERPDDITDRAAPFKVDLVEKRVAFPGNEVEFSRRGVLKGKDGKLRTYQIGHDYDLYDTYRNKHVDGKEAIRNERSLWREALSELEEGEELNGVDLSDSSLNEIKMWTSGRDDRPPVINGRSVYEIAPPTGPAEAGTRG